MVLTDLIRPSNGLLALDFIEISAQVYTPAAGGSIPSTPTGRVMRSPARCIASMTLEAPQRGSAPQHARCLASSRLDTVRSIQSART